MTNSIKARVSFSFRGEHFNPELIIDLDELLKARQDFTRLREKLAQANGIDTYSYEFEVMESCDIEFSEATGDAEAFLLESGEFDLDGYSQFWHSCQSGGKLLDIARTHMKIDSLDQIEGLAEALQAAYDAGASSR